MSKSSWWTFSVIMVVGALALIAYGISLLIKQRSPVLAVGNLAIGGLSCLLVLRT